MNQRLTRRRFGCLAIASTAVAGLGYLASKTFAQTPTNLVIYGARPVPKAGGIGLQSLDVALGQVQTLTTATLELNEKLTGFTSLTDGTLVLGISPVRTGKKEDNSPRLVFLGTSPRTLTVSGLKKEDTLESLLGLNDGSLIGLVIKKNGRPPVDLVDIDISTGEISLIDKIKLPQTDRFSNLAQCPNGTIYTTAVGRLGETSLVQLDLGQGKPILRAQLKFNDEVWSSGLDDLVCSPASQLFALAAPRYVTPNNLYTVDAKTGAMTLLRSSDVTKITFPGA